MAALVDARSRKLSVLLKQAGMVGSPQAIARRSVERCLRASVAAVPVGVLASVLLSPWFILLCLIPLWWLVAPELALRDSVASRREGVERELPFFSVLINVLGGAGIPVYSIQIGRAHV